MSAECTCPLAPEEYQHRYGGATEPGGAREYDPECPEHGQSRPESQQQEPIAATTSAEGSQAASEALSGQSAAFPAVRTLTSAELERREQVAALLWDTDREVNALGIAFAVQRQSVKNVYLQAARLAMRFLDTYDDHGGRVDLVRDSAP